MAKNKLKMNKFLTGAVTATMVATAVVPMASANVAAAKEFSDVPATDAHYQNIMQAVERELFKGYNDGTFKPYNDIKRSHVAKVLANYVVSQDGSADYAAYIEKHDLATNVKAFNDVSSTHSDKELFNASLIVKAAGIFEGSNNNLMPTNTISRQQMAKVLVNGFGLQDLPGDLSEVKDNNTAFAEFVPYINILSENGVTTETNFKPTSKVKRAQMASFLNRAFDIADKQVGAGVVSVSAINTTTVEVTFKEAIEDIKALDFKIEGLTVENAVVKQTGGDKVAVLTTSTQEGGKKYDVTLAGNKVGSFVGVSAVIPTAINVTTPSVQGTIGKEVTVSAQVTVADGASKAGIPVTFNIVNDRDNLNSKIEVEAFTNADGVASYSYTRYYKHNDNVAAYATDKASVVASGKVYWAETLALTEVTEGNTLANGSKKVYKVSSPELAGKYVNVTFKENVQVTPDKITVDAKFTDARVFNVNADKTLSELNSPDSKYAYEVTTGGTRIALVKLNGNGEATFTLEGTNASVTPVAFYDGEYKLDTAGNPIALDANNGKLGAQELQFAAPTVKFELRQNYQVTVEAAGTANAAADTTTGDGGREYTVTYKDTDGKIAPAGSVVKVFFAEGSTSTTGTQIHVDDTLNGTFSKTIVANSKDTFGAANWVDLKVDSKGQVSFVVTGDKDKFITPIVVINNGTNVNTVDSADLVQNGEITYFVNAVLTAAKLTTTSALTGRPVASVTVNEDVWYTYQSVDQNGFSYYNSATQNFVTTFQVDTRFAEVDVYAADGVTKLSPAQVVNGRATFYVTAVNGVAKIKVDGKTAGQVTVDASASQSSLPNKSASVTFTSFSNADLVTGIVTATATADDEFTLLDKSGTSHKYSYVGARFLLSGNTIDKSTFEALLVNNKEISVTKAADGVLVFNIIGTASLPAVPTVSPFTDTDLDAGQIEGTLTYTATAGLVYDIYLGAAKVKTAVATGSSETYTVAQDTPAVATIKVVVRDTATGYTNSTTINVTDLGTATTESIALSKIENAAKAQVWDGVTITDFANAGVTGVSATNFLDVKSGVQAARALKGSALTKPEIQGIVSPLAAAEALAQAFTAINAGTAVLADYTTAGITGVTATNLAAVNTTVAAARVANANVDLLKPAIQTAADDTVAVLGAATALTNASLTSVNNTLDPVVYAALADAAGITYEITNVTDTAVTSTIAPDKKSVSIVRTAAGSTVLELTVAKGDAIEVVTFTVTVPASGAASVVKN